MKIENPGVFYAMTMLEKNMPPQVAEVVAGENSPKGASDLVLFVL